MTTRVTGPPVSGFVAGRFPIDAYGDGGFRFAGMSHRGSILCLPSGIHAWQVATAASLTPDDLRAVVEQAPGAIDFLLLGTGETLVPVAPPLRQWLKDRGIAVDPMSTGNAARTYNILLGEKRRVAAALVAIG